MPQQELTYFEELSAVGMTCPHADAFAPDGATVYYRVLKSNPATSECFLPTPIREDRPLPEGFDACIGKSVSVYDDLQGMLKGFFKIPANKGKRKAIGVLKLGPQDGKLKQTFTNKHHHSWWRSQAFDLAAVTVQEIEL
jgi:hypothetical protein